MRKRVDVDLPMLAPTLLLSIWSIFAVWSASGGSVPTTGCRVMQVIVGLLTMVILAGVSSHLCREYAFLPYLMCVFLLLLVRIGGCRSRGAQRWLSLGVLRFQPSELAKLVVPLVVARLSDRVGRLSRVGEIAAVLIFILIPVLLVMMQPDLGTAILILSSGLLILFVSGTDWKSMLLVLLFVAVLGLILWHFFARQYQRNRIAAFLDPKGDPLGMGYNVIQSKIAIGSGGWTGKGWLRGTQSRLRFLPECCTDFILATIGEEFGFVGVFVLAASYLTIIARGLLISLRSRHAFCRVFSGGMMVFLFVCVFANVGMTTGMLPVVGVPLPLVSYGGSSTVVLMAGIGIVMAVRNCCVGRGRSSRCNEQVSRSRVGAPR